MKAFIRNKILCGLPDVVFPLLVYDEPAPPSPANMRTLYLTSLLALAGATLTAAATPSARATPNPRGFSRVRLEDHFRPPAGFGADAFLFRGGQAINANSSFAYEELTAKFREVAGPSPRQRGFILPPYRPACTQFECPPAR